MYKYTVGIHASLKQTELKFEENIYFSWLFACTGSGVDPSGYMAVGHISASN